MVDRKTSIEQDIMDTVRDRARMNVERTPAFRLDLRRVADWDTQRRVQEKVAELEAASTPLEVTNVMHMSSEGCHYRIRIVAPAGH